jgi:hypothetical protein
VNMGFVTCKALTIVEIKLYHSGATQRLSVPPYLKISKAKNFHWLTISLILDQGTGPVSGSNAVLWQRYWW